MNDEQMLSFRKVLIEIFKFRYSYHSNDTSGFKWENKYDMQVINSAGEIIIPYLYESRVERLNNKFNECEIKIYDYVEINNIYEYLLSDKSSYDISIINFQISEFKIDIRNGKVLNKNRTTNDEKVLVKKLEKLR